MIRLRFVPLQIALDFHWGFCFKSDERDLDGNHKLELWTIIRINFTGLILRTSYEIQFTTFCFHLLFINRFENLRHGHSHRVTFHCIQNTRNRSTQNFIIILCSPVFTENYIRIRDIILSTIPQTRQKWNHIANKSK